MAVPSFLFFWGNDFILILFGLRQVISFSPFFIIFIIFFFFSFVNGCMFFSLGGLSLSFSLSKTHTQDTIFDDLDNILASVRPFFKRISWAAASNKQKSKSAVKLRREKSDNKLLLPVAAVSHPAIHWWWVFSSLSQHTTAQSINTMHTHTHTQKGEWWGRGFYGHCRRRRRMRDDVQRIVWKR